MAQNKTVETTSSVDDFINALQDDTKRKDCLSLIKLMKNHTMLDPKMWGPSIVGFGSYHYKYDSGREGDSPLICFSPRVSSIALYLSGSLENRDELLKNLGKHKTDKGCIHIKKLSDIDLEILHKMIENHIQFIKKAYPEK
jgi:hypothetical protein